MVISRSDLLAECRRLGLRGCSHLKKAELHARIRDHVGRQRAAKVPAFCGIDLIPDVFYHIATHLVGTSTFGHVLRLSHAIQVQCLRHVMAHQEERLLTILKVGVEVSGRPRRVYVSPRLLWWHIERYLQLSVGQWITFPQYLSYPEIDACRVPMTPALWVACTRLYPQEAPAHSLFPTRVLLDQWPSLDDLSSHRKFDHFYVHRWKCPHFLVWFTQRRHGSVFSRLNHQSLIDMIPPPNSAWEPWLLYDHPTLEPIRHLLRRPQRLSS